MEGVLIQHHTIQKNFFPTPGEISPTPCLYNQDRYAHSHFAKVRLMNRIAAPKSKSGRRYVVAMLLGTTLSALGAATAQAVPTPETTVRAVTDMSRYCTTCWRNAHLPPDCWTDCTQEVLCRLMERVDPEAWSQVLKAEGDERK